MRPLVKFLTFIYLVLACRPCFEGAKYLLWIFTIDDAAFTISWVLLLLYFSTFIVAVWMFIMNKMGLWDG